MKLPKCANREADALESKSMIQRGMDMPTNESRARTAFRAAVDYARSERDGLDQGLDLQANTRILEILVHLGLPADEVLYRIENAEHIDELLLVLPKFIPKDALREYYELLVDGPEPIPYEELRDCDAFKKFEAVLIDDLWERQVTERLVRGDVRRCWDEVKRAGYHDPPLGVVERLIELLHSKLCENGSLHGLSEEILEIHGRRRRMAGFGFACKFCEREKGTFRFGRTGQMVLTLAQYFSQQRTIKRTARYRRAQPYRSSFAH